MIKTMKLGGVTAVLTTLLAALAACTTTTQPVQSIEPTSRTMNQPTADPTSQPTPEPERPFPDLPNLGEAPEIRNETWINTDTPVTLADSRGKVVLLEFWTFG